MCLLFESIRVEDHKWVSLEDHIERMNISRQVLLGESGKFLSDQFRIPEGLNEKLHKCRIFYDKEIRKIEFVPYLKRKISRIKIVHHNELDYSFKYSDRKAFERFQEQYPDFDEYIIIKNGSVTDSTFSNLAFYDGAQWLTPSTFLLNGIRRKSLLINGLIKESEIHPEDLGKFEKVSFINAMLNLGELSVDLKDNKNPSKPTYE